MTGHFPDLVGSVIFSGSLIRILIWILILTPNKIEKFLNDTRNHENNGALRRSIIYNIQRMYLILFTSKIKQVWNPSFDLLFRV